MSSPIEAYRRMAQWIATKYRMVDPKTLNAVLCMSTDMAHPLAAHAGADFDSLVAELSLAVVGDKAFPVHIDAASVLGMICESINAPKILHTAATIGAKADINATVRTAIYKAMDTVFQGIVAELTCEVEGEQGGAGNIAADIAEVGAQLRVIVSEVFASLFAADYSIATAFGLDDFATPIAGGIKPDVQIDVDFDCTPSYNTQLGMDTLDGTTIDMGCIVGADVYHLWGEYVDMRECDFANLIEKEVVKTEI